MARPPAQPPYTLMDPYAQHRALQQQAQHPQRISPGQEAANQQALAAQRAQWDAHQQLANQSHQSQQPQQAQIQQAQQAQQDIHMMRPPGQPPNGYQVYLDAQGRPVAANGYNWPQLPRTNSVHQVPAVQHPGMPAQHQVMLGQHQLYAQQQIQRHYEASQRQQQALEQQAQAAAQQAQHRQSVSINSAQTPSHSTVIPPTLHRTPSATIAQSPAIVRTLSHQGSEHAAARNPSPAPLQAMSAPTPAAFIPNRPQAESTPARPTSVRSNVEPPSVSKPSAEPTACPSHPAVGDRQDSLGQAFPPDCLEISNTIPPQIPSTVPAPVQQQRFHAAATRIQQKEDRVHRLQRQIEMAQKELDEVMKEDGKRPEDQGTDGESSSSRSMKEKFDKHIEEYLHLSQWVQSSNGPGSALVKTSPSHTSTNGHRDSLFDDDSEHGDVPRSADSRKSNEPSRSAGVKGEISSNSKSRQSQSPQNAESQKSGDQQDLGFLFSWYTVFEDTKRFLAEGRFPTQTRARENEAVKPVADTNPSSTNRVDRPNSANLAAKIAISTPAAAVQAAQADADSNRPSRPHEASATSLSNGTGPVDRNNAVTVKLQAAEAMRKSQQAQIDAQNAEQKKVPNAPDTPSTILRQMMAAQEGRPRPVQLFDGTIVHLTTQQIQQHLMARSQAQAQAQSQMFPPQLIHPRRQFSDNGCALPRANGGAWPENGLHDDETAEGRPPTGIYHPKKIEDGGRGTKRKGDQSPLGAASKKSRFQNKRPTPEEHQRQALEVASRAAALSSASSHFSHFFSTSSPGQIATQSPIVMGESPAGPYNLDSTGSPTSARSKKRPRPTLNIRGNSEAAQNDLESAHSVTGDGPEKRGGKKSRAKKAPGAKSGNGQLSASTNASGSPATSHLPNLPSAASAPLPQHHHDVFQPGNAAPSPMALPRSAMTQQSLGLGFPPVPDMPSVQTQNGPVPGESGSHVDDLFKAFTGFTGTDHAPLSSGGQMSLEEGFDFDWTTANFGGDENDWPTLPDTATMPGTSGN